MTATDDLPHILIVDDDERICALLKKYLSANGYRASTAADGDEAGKRMAGIEFDLLIIDVMMPGISGFELTKRVRAASDVPIILLTARVLPQDRIMGLEHGADDYLPKPFEPRELLLRVAALLRRSRRGNTERQLVQFGAFSFEPSRGELRRDDKLVRLTAGELSLLRSLAAKPAHPISRLTLAEQISNGTERAVDVQVTRLRKKIEDDPRTPIYLQTVRGVGYALFPDT